MTFGVRSDQVPITDPSRQQRLGEEFALHFRLQQEKSSWLLAESSILGR